MTNRRYNKVFCIGYNKTGTTTLELVLQNLGFIMPEQWRQEIALTEKTLDGDYTPFHAYVSRFEAFQDLPFSSGDTYVACDAFFPKSKFILTVREPEAWFASMCRFHQQLWNVDDVRSLTEADMKKMFYLYDGYIHRLTARLLTTEEDGRKVVRWDLLYDHDFYIDKYLKRNDEIRAYFRRRPDDLLEIDVTEEADTAKLCRFLDIPPDRVGPMPHENRSA